MTTARALGLKAELKRSGKFVTGLDGSPLEVLSGRLRLTGPSWEAREEASKMPEPHLHR